MIVVTGGAGFIGSNLVDALNKRGANDILVVDDLSDSLKIRNLETSLFTDYMDKDEFLTAVAHRRLEKPEVIFHQGACSDTMEYNGRFMMDTNYAYSKTLLHYCLDESIPFIYASSASVYGDGRNFSEQPENEKALNVYAFSKLQFDRYVRRLLPRAQSQVVGLRYFNVYGPGETHKRGMASVAYHFYNQYKRDGQVRLFVGSDGYGDGEQERDFVWVGDVANVNMHFWDHPDIGGIFNVGTGKSRSFNDVALAVINARGGHPATTLAEARSLGKIDYVPFPDGLQDKYQSYTCADTGNLCGAGYETPFLSIEEGVKEYVKRLETADDG